MITNEGIIIRIGCEDISVLKRITSGVKLMNVDTEAGIKVANIAKVREEVKNEQEEESEGGPEVQPEEGSKGDPETQLEKRSVEIPGVQPEEET